MQDRKRLFGDIDWVTVIIYGILVVVGWLTIYASVYDDSHQSILDFNMKYGKQFLWILTGVALCGIILIIDAKFYSNFALLIYIATIILLVGVLVFGREIAGSKSWLEIGSIRLQPSEFAKFGTSLALAKYLSGLHVKFQELRTKIIAGAIVSVPAILIVLQGDAGSALVYTSFVLVMYRVGLSGNILILGLFFALLFVMALLMDNLILISILASFAMIPIYLVRKQKRHLKKYVILAGIGLIVCSGFVYGVDFAINDILKPHQRVRINVLLGIESDPLGAGYNVNQSKIAIGSGSFFGKGFLNGTQTKYDFVPEQSTDFIFCTVGEEHGFVGSVLIIALFFTLLFRVIYIAERQRSTFTLLYGYGVASVLFFHITINVGMTLGLAPVIGIPFPFFSYGGSSLWAFTILLFILIKLDSERLTEFR